VIVYPWIGDGVCPACKVGDEHICDNPNSLGIFGDLDANIVSSLACSGLTSYTAVKNASPSPKQNMVIIGTGGLGLMAIQIARALFNPTITAVDIDDERLRQAKKLGADYGVNSMSVNTKPWC